MYSIPNGKPGTLPTFSAVPRELFSANRSFAQFVAGPVTIDGTLSGNALNAPNTWLLQAGLLMGRVTATGKYANSVIGLTSTAYSHTTSNTTIQTDVNTAAEVVRRIGATGTLKLVGPPTAGGAVAVQVATYSAINLTTGAITITAVGADIVAGSLIQPTDGSEVIVTVLCDAWGASVTDATHSTRLDVFTSQLLAAGGTISTPSILNYPTDSSLKAWIKGELRVACPAVNFSDDFS